jgi:ADP-ribosylglycohydrolase
MINNINNYFEKNNDKIMGTIHGQAYGDALGLTTEFLSKQQIKEKYKKRNISISDKISDQHRDSWEYYDWTDDTDQMILVARSIYEFIKNRDKKIDIKEYIINNKNQLSIIFAKKLKYWYYNGFPELNDVAGCGIGNYMGWIIKDNEFTNNPIKISKEIWENSLCSNTENGSMMRTSVIGCLPFSLDIKLLLTDIICITTHYDPRCRAGCAYLVTIIHELINFNYDIDDIKLKSLKSANKYLYGKYTQKFHNYLNNNIDLNKIDFNNGEKRGKIKYVFLCIIFILNNLKSNPISYHYATQFIIHLGGDSDTNCCIIGSIVGAYYGYDKIKHIVNTLHKNWLTNQMTTYIYGSVY